MMTKFAYSAVAALAAYTVSAAEADRNLPEIVADLLRNTTETADGLPVPRAILDMMGDSGDNINEYGCWCYFGGDHGRGKSHPVDEMDAFCKVLAESYDCVMLDQEEENDEEECIPWEVFYMPASISDADKIVQQCTDRNPSNCARRACIVETQFVTSVFRFILGGGKLNEEHQHRNGFDVNESCPTKPGIKSEKSCCGDYPYRHPFKTYGGQRSCCGSKTYDNRALKCCSDGKIRATC